MRSRGSFTRTVNVFVSNTSDLSNVMCKQHNMNMLNTFLNATKKPGDIEGTCKRTVKGFRLFDVVRLVLEQ